MRKVFKVLEHLPYMTDTNASPIHIWALARKTLSSGVCDHQKRRPAVHLRRLICAFAIPFLESIISKLATGAFLIFKLISVAEETGLSLAFAGNPKDRFSRIKAHMHHKPFSNGLAYKFNLQFIVCLRSCFFHAICPSQLRIFSWVEPELTLR